MALSIQKGASEGPPPPTSSNLRFPGSLSSPKAQPAPPHLGGAAHTRPSENASCVCRGVWRPGLGTLPNVPSATGQPRCRDPYRAPASLCPETNPLSCQPTLGFQSIVRVLLFGSFFGYFPLSGGRGGRAPHAGLGTCPFPDASQAPTPPAAYVYNVQSVPPSRKKELPRPVKMAGVQKGGMGASPLSKARIQIKKYIILIII